MGFFHVCKRMYFVPFHDAFFDLNVMLRVNTKNNHGSFVFSMRVVKTAQICSITFDEEKCDVQIRNLLKSRKN